MKIAIAGEGKMLSQHFGRCSVFHLYKVSGKNAEFIESIAPPSHEPGLIPKWLTGYKIDTVITGGMGRKAKDIFEENKIRVIDGVEAADCESIANDFANGKIKKGISTCDH